MLRRYLSPRGGQWCSSGAPSVVFTAMPYTQKPISSAATGSNPVGGRRTAASAHVGGGSGIPSPSADIGSTTTQANPRADPLFEKSQKVDETRRQLSEDAKYAIAGANEAFMERVDSLNKSYTKMYSSATKKEKKKEQKLKTERRSMLTFREVDTSLDRVIISRDLFLWLKCIFRGTDYVIDQFLERELRYYPINAMAELKMFPKLFRGMPKIASKGKPFPTLGSLSRMDTIAPADVPMKGSSSQPKIASGSSEGANDAKPAPAADGKKMKRWDIGQKGEPKAVLSSSSFKRPTLVIISQLAHADHNTEQQWMEAFAEYTQRQAKTGAARCSEHIIIRTMDQYGVFWLKRLVVRKYAEYLPVEQRARTYVGQQLIRKFMTDFDLRNFMTTYAMIVDHTGHVRWMASGAIADSEEKKAFFNALTAVELEYYRKGQK